MSNQITTARYYPQLAEIIKSDNLPDFIKDLIDEHLSKFYFRNFQYSKSSNGDTVYYSLDLISKEQITIEIIDNLLFI